MNGSRIAAASCAGLLALLAARLGSAQCAATTSSCRSCHDGVHAHFDAGTKWHRDHAFADMCVACHGGDAAATNEPAAHAGLARPTDGCESCHGSRAAAFAASYLGEAPKAPPPPLIEARRTPHWRDAVLAAVIVVVAAWGGTWIARTERRWRELPSR